MTPPAFVPYGAWVDSPPFEVLKVAWWQEFKGLGFSTAAIMVETFRDGLDERWEDDQIAHAGVLARQHDIELVLTFMPEPRRDYLVEYERRAPVLCELSVAAGLDSDLEGNWLPRLVEGFRDLTEAGVELVRIQRTFSRKLDIRLEADTFPFHGENSAQARVAPYVDRVYPQGYSVRRRKDGTGKEILVDWDDRFGPNLMPRVTLDRTLQVPGVRDGTGPKLAIGLAAYDQNFEGGHTPEEAMRVARAAALVYKPVETRYWSTKHILGPRANPYARRFFRELALEQARVLGR